MIAALISQVKGMAVFDDGKRVGYLDVTQFEGRCYSDEQIIARALAEASDLESLEVADITALRTHLLIRKRREELLHATLILLDGERNGNLREQAARTLSMERDYDAWSWVEGVLMSTPLPDTADALGAAEWATPYKEFFVELVALQGKIKILHTAWHALPNTLFTKETREQVRAKFVRHGVFRNLLRGTTPSIGNPFSTALASYSVALERSSETRPSPTHNPGGRWLELHISSNATIRRIWEISPWQSSWLATEWPRLESILACQAAANWVSRLTSVRTFKRNRIRNIHAGLTVLFDSWEAVRHHSKLSSLVDLIYSLAEARHAADPSLLTLSEVEAFAKRPHRRPSAETLGFDSAPHTWDSVDIRDLQTLILEFFDAPRKQVNEDYKHPSWANVNESNEVRDAIRWRAIAEHAHLALDLRAPINSSQFVDTLQESQHANLSPDLHRDISHWITPLRYVVALYALDRVFQQGGCVVHVLPKNFSVANRYIQRRAVLLNLNNRRSQIFEGYLAWLLGHLQDRLIADLQSGLPRERCGWMQFSDLSENLGKSEDSVAQGLATLRRYASSAGFASETFQQQAGGIRLNPELVTPSKLSTEDMSNVSR